MNNSPEGAPGSANSGTPRTDAARLQFRDEKLESVHADFARTLERQLAQSEERVKELTEGLDKLTAWGMYCPDWADRNSKDEYAKDFMAVLALLSSSKTN